MTYTFHQLRIFIKVVELCSVTKAAEELFLTQPAVSIQLKKFQDQFSVPLTEVIKRQLFITPFGHEIAEAGRRILDEADKIKYAALNYEGKLAGRLSFSVVSTGKYVMPYFLSGFTKQHPGIDYVLDVTNKTKVLQSLENNEVDFALVSILPDHLPLETMPLMQNQLMLVGSSELEGEREMEARQILSEMPLLFREEGSATRSAMEDYINDEAIQITKKLELTSNEALKQALIAGLGYSIVPLIGLRHELNNGDLRLIPLPGLPITTMWNLVWYKNKRLSPAAQAFLDYLEAHKSVIVEKYFSWTKQFDLLAHD